MKRIFPKYISKLKASVMYLQRKNIFHEISIAFNVAEGLPIPSVSLVVSFQSINKEFWKNLEWF